MSKIVTYFNKSGVPLDKACDLPYDVVNLAFIYSEHSDPFKLKLGGAIAATEESFTQATVSAIEALQSKGKKVLISFGGDAMDYNTYGSLSKDPMRIAQSLANFVRTNNLDGIDIDYEDTTGFQRTGGYDGESFLISLTQELRRLLPKPTYFISHAPQPPYLEKESGIGGYIKVVEEVGLDIDWLNIQFYNNQPWNSNPDRIVSSYLNYSNLPNMSSDKIIAGFPVTEKDAQLGYMPVNTIVHNIITPLKNLTQFGGVMGWQFSSDVDYSWVRSINSALDK